MKREILFRGLRIDGKGWVYGDLQQNFDCFKIREKEVDCIAKSYVVESESVGQFTGLTDKKGKKIFEWDKLRVVMSLTAGKPITKDLEVIYHEGLFCVQWSNFRSYDALNYFSTNVTFEVIGNIHESK